MTGTDVMKLQQFLGISPSTGYYGPKTAAAVSRFQEKYSSDVLVPNKLAKGTGTVGVSTRTKLNSLCVAAQEPVVSAATASPVSEAGVPSSSSLAVTASAQPEHSLAPANANYVPFTTVTFTAGASDVTVSSVTIERAGMGSDSAFYDVGLLDPTGYEFSCGYLNAKHQVTLHDPFTIPAGTSETYTIVGDMNDDLSGNDGEMPVLQLDAITADAPVSGAFPLRGTAQTVNSSLTIGSATVVLSPDDPGVSSRTKYVNDTGIRFSGIRITASSAEDLKLGSISWEQSGSASQSDITNLATVVNGVSYPAETTDGRYYTSTFGDGLTIKKGASLDAVIVGDLTTTGANRTAEFDIHYSTDIALVGETYGFGINVYPDGNTDTAGDDVFLTSDGTTDGNTLTPFFSGSVTNISAGAFSGIQSR